VRKQSALRVGFGAMIALLLVSAVEAYRIQRATWQQSAEIHRRHLQEEEALYRLRRILFLGGIYTRDFISSNRLDRASKLKNQLAQLKEESQEALDELDRMPPPKLPSAALRSEIREYWKTVEPVSDWPEDVRNRGFDVLQEQIAPRRNAAGDLVHDLTLASHEALQDSEAQFASSRRSAALRLLVILGLCLVSGLATAFLSLRHSDLLEKETAQHYDALAHAKRRLEQLSARLLTIQEEERRRLSMELHDEVGQTLTALRLEISHAESIWRDAPPEVQERLERTRGLAEKTLQTVRDISLLLRPPLLDDLGLSEALQWQLEEFSRRTGIPVDFSEESLEDLLPEPYKICAYRIVQEALHNCETHAEASTVRVCARQSALGLFVQIEDDGRGFVFNLEPAAIPAGGLGILGMQERAAMLGGSLEIDSVRGRGTRIALWLPPPQDLPAAAEADPQKVPA
jgi:signal transduction histidine kinase